MLVETGQILKNGRQNGENGIRTKEKSGREKRGQQEKLHNSRESTHGGAFNGNLMSQWFNANKLRSVC